MDIKKETYIEVKSDDMVVNPYVGSGGLHEVNGKPVRLFVLVEE